MWQGEYWPPWLYRNVWESCAIGAVVEAVVTSCFNYICLALCHINSLLQNVHYLPQPKGGRVCLCSSTPPWVSWQTITLSQSYYAYSTHNPSVCQNSYDSSTSPPPPSVPPFPVISAVCKYSNVLVICWILFHRYKSTARLPYKFTKPSVALKRWHTQVVFDRMVNCWLPGETRELFGCLMLTVNRCWGCSKAILGELS